MLEGFYTTAKGLEYFAKAAAGKRLKFTIGKFGSGVLDEAINPATVTEIVNPLGTLPIVKKSTEANKVTVITSFNNRVGNAFLPEFHLTEVGLYGRIETEDGSVDPEGTEALLLYSYTEPSRSDFIPATLSEFTIAFPIILSGSANVSVSIDEGLVYTTRKDFEEHTFFRTNGDGTGSSIIVSESSLSLVDRLGLIVKLKEDMVDNATLSFNGSKAYPIKTMNGEFITAGGVAGAYIEVVFSAEDECWYLIGGTGGGGGGSNTDLITTEFIESIEGEVPEIDVAVQYAIDKAVSEHASDKNNPHGVTAKQVDALALDGSTKMRGPIYMENVNDYFAIQKDRTVSGVTHRLTLGIGVNGAATVEHYTDKSGTSTPVMRLEMHSLEEDTSNAVVIRKNSGETAYKLFGEHNKPTGYYHGNGDATQRVINIGGTGSILWIRSAKYLTFVWGFGGFTLDGTDGTVRFHESTVLDFENGKLTIASTDSAINDDVNVHYYGYVD